MLIYNFQKEFLGIDEKDLKFLGFKDLSALRNEVSDFADLFVKTPGYIHNFKHVHWIDFITCADSNEESKVIINVNNKNYKCFVHISTAYLVDNPSSKAYLINLHKLQELSKEESEKISGDITERVATHGTTEVKPILNTPDISDEFITDTQESFEVEEISTSVTHDPYETPLEIDMSEDVVVEENSNSEDIVADTYDTPEEDLSLDLDVSSLELDYEDPEEENLFETETPHAQEQPKVTPKEQESLQEEVFDNGYVYDPSVASEELGLPLDLIEEFIQDFIEQAKEFEPKLYDALEEQDLDNLKILSHKLKGVAANLRIEDALEALTIINTSNDTLVIHENLDLLYKIIMKLSGEKEPQVAVEPQIEEEEVIATEEASPEPEITLEEIEDEDEDELVLEFKEDDLTENVPEENIAIEDEITMDDTFKIELEEPPSEEPTIEIALDDINDDIAIEIEQEEEQEEIQQEEVQLQESINYSKEKIANEIGLELSYFNELFEDYITEANEITTHAKELIQNEDFQTLQREILKLKGMSNNMRVDAFSDSLEILSNDVDKSELLQALSIVENTLQQLSSIGE